MIESGEKPIATLFDALTYKKKKQIFIPSERECAAREFVTATFTLDSKNVVVVTGEPDWHMYVFKSDKAKLESFTRANNSNGTGLIKQVCLNISVF